MAHDSPTRLTAADWVAWARECKAVGRDDLILTCLNHAAALASEEGGRTLAEMLEEGDGRREP
jgi:hypothetical protein